VFDCDEHNFLLTIDDSMGLCHISSKSTALISDLRSDSSAEHRPTAFFASWEQVALNTVSFHSPLTFTCSQRKDLIRSVGRKKVKIKMKTK
jgi:hypothetical protein